MAMYGYKDIPVFGKTLYGTIVFESATEPAKVFTGNDLYITPILNDVTPTLTLAVNRGDVTKRCAVVIKLSRCSYLNVATGILTDDQGGFSEQATFWKGHGVKILGKAYTDKGTGAKRIARYRFLDIELRGAQNLPAGNMTDLPASFKEVVAFCKSHDESASLRILLKVTLKASVPDRHLKRFIEICERFSKRMETEEEERQAQQRRDEEERRQAEEEEQQEEAAALDGDASQSTGHSPTPASSSKPTSTSSKRSLDPDESANTGRKRQKSSIKVEALASNATQMQAKLAAMFALKNKIELYATGRYFDEQGMAGLITEMGEITTSLTELSAVRGKLIGNE